MHINKKQSSGFTLIELLIAITLASILLAIAIPQYLGYLQRGQASEGMSLAAQLTQGAIEAYQFTNQVPTTLADAGFPGAANTDFSGRYTTSVGFDAAGSVVIIYGNDAGSDINGQTLVLNPATNGIGNLMYLCDTAALPAGLVAANVPVTSSSIPTTALPRDCR